MNIPEMIKEAHENAVERGFYDCPECHGKPIKMGDLDMSHGGMSCEITECKSCNGSGIDQNKNIGELLMDIIGSLYRALEAHRNNRFAELQRLDHFIKNHNQMIIEDCDQWYYLTNIKDTREDKIADVFTRLFDLCGYLGIEPKPIFSARFLEEVKLVSEMLFCITRKVVNIGYGDKKETVEASLDMLMLMCNKLNIPIEKHIKAKMAYNRSLK